MLDCVVLEQISTKLTSKISLFIYLVFIFFREMGRCALHHCASRNYLQLINYITGGSSRWTTSNPQEKPIYSACKKLFEGVVELNLRFITQQTRKHSNRLIETTMGIHLSISPQGLAFKMSLRHCVMLELMVLPSKIRKVRRLPFKF